VVDSTADDLVGDLVEESFDEVEPAGAGRGEAQVAQQPAFHGRGLVGGVVVWDQVDVQIGGDGGVDLSQELRELLLAVTAVQRSDHLAGGRQAVARLVELMAGLSVAWRLSPVGRPARRRAGVVLVWFPSGGCVGSAGRWSDPGPLLMRYCSVMNESREGTEPEPVWRRKSISLPIPLAEWVDIRAAKGGASAYIARLIEADRHGQLVRDELEEFGYTGDMAVTDAGRARAREALDRHAASRAARSRRKAA
jgi:hypothetical protein